MRIFLALILVAAACTAPGVEVRTGSDDTPRRGGRIVVGNFRDIATLQPLLAGDLASQNVVDRIYERLLSLDPDTGDLAPGLAEAYELSPDGLTLVYTLRPGLVWSDGQPLTAADAKYTLEALARSKRGARGALEDVTGYAEYAEGRSREITGIQVGDGGRRLTIQLRRSSCTSARTFGIGVQPIPKHVFSKHWESATLDRAGSIDDSPYDLAPPLASGPFQFKEYRPGVQVTLIRNERYHLGAPLIEEVIFKVYSDDQAIKAALLTGEVTWAAVAPDAVAEIRGSTAAPQLALRQTPSTSSYLALQLNQRSLSAPWLADRRVRQALWYGLNIDDIVDKVRLGYAHRVFAHTPTVSWAYDAGSALKRYPFDPERARELIRSTGAVMGSDGIYRWTDGRRMRMRIETVRGDTLREAVVQVAQEQYRAIGIDVEASLTTLPALIAHFEGDFHGALLFLGLGADPNNAFGRWHSSQIGFGNGVGFSNAAVDAALEAGRYGPDCSTTARRAAYSTVDRILNEEAPFVFLLSDHQLVFQRTDLVAPPPKPWRPWNDLEKWWLRR